MNKGALVPPSGQLLKNIFFVYFFLVLFRLVEVRISVRLVLLYVFLLGRHFVTFYSGDRRSEKQGVIGNTFLK